MIHNIAKRDEFYIIHPDLFHEKNGIKHWLSQKSPKDYKQVFRHVVLTQCDRTISAQYTKQDLRVKFSLSGEIHYDYQFAIVSFLNHQIEIEFFLTYVSKIKEVKNFKISWDE